MNGPDQSEPGITRSARVLDQVRSNVTVCANLFPRTPDDLLRQQLPLPYVPQDVILEKFTMPPERDVAFRCRVRGSIALHNIVPPGIISSVTGKHEIRRVAEADRTAAFQGTLQDPSFALLPEQVGELNAFRCIVCRRSTVSVWFEKGRVRRQFVQCMCQRSTRQEESQ